VTAVHAQSYNWIARYTSDDPLRILDIGGRDINGSPRLLFPNADYTVLDAIDGGNVDIIADASTWVPDREYDLVISAECFEHTPVWPEICATAHKALRPGGLFIATMAGPGRPEHSGVDGGWVLHDGEHYANVKPAALRRVLLELGFGSVLVDQQFNPADVRAVAVK
jgi:SAM-dependent methyltransferase